MEYYKIQKLISKMLLYIKIPAISLVGNFNFLILPE